MADPHVRVRLGALRKFEKELRGDLRGVGRGPIRDALLQWGVRYRSFAQERFDRFSKGGGDWKPLSKSTLHARRRKGFKVYRRNKAGKRVRRGVRRGAKSEVGQRPAILRDTGSLFNALEPQAIGKPGALQQRIPYGIRVGFGGPAKPRAMRGKKSKATIAEIASYHQKGSGRLPKREIIVDPPRQVTERMADDMERALARLARKKGISGP